MANNIILVAVFAIVAIGVIIPLVVLPFGFLPSPDSLVFPISNFISDGITIDVDLGLFPLDFNLNPFAIIGETGQTYLASYVNSFGFIPNTLLIPMVVVLLVIIVLGIREFIGAT